MSLRTILALLHFREGAFTVQDVESMLAVARVTGFGKIKKWLALGWIDRKGFEEVEMGVRPHSQYAVSQKFIDSISELLSFRDITSKDLSVTLDQWHNLTVSQLIYLKQFRYESLSSREFKTRTEVSEALGRRTLITLTKGDFIKVEKGAGKARQYKLTKAGAAALKLLKDD